MTIRGSAKGHARQYANTRPNRSPEHAFMESAKSGGGPLGALVLLGREGTTLRFSLTRPSEGRAICPLYRLTSRVHKGKNEFGEALFFALFGDLGQGTESNTKW
jgi:hypothetical protein